MLIALLTILFLGGGTYGPMLFIEEASDTAKTAIVDADRRKMVQADLKLMQKRTKQHSKSTKGLTKHLKREFGDYDAGDADLDVYWDQIFSLNAEYSADIADMRFAMRDKLSREEWEALFPATSPN